MPVERLRITDIQTNSGTQARLSIKDYRVEFLASLYDDTENWPFTTKCVVFYDGDLYYLADGFHRLFASIAAGKQSVFCDVREGTLEDAIEFAAGANSVNEGMPLDNADFGQAVEMLLSLEKWKDASNQAIADHIGCNESTVRRNRRQNDTGSARAEPAFRVGKDGKKYPATQNRKPKPESDNGKQVETEKGGKEEENRKPGKSKIQHNPIGAEVPEDVKRRQLELIAENVRRHVSDISKWLWEGGKLQKPEAILPDELYDEQQKTVRRVIGELMDVTREITGVEKIGAVS